jgi:hypothetical protein
LNGALKIMSKSIPHNPNVGRLVLRCDGSIGWLPGESV